MNFKDPAVIYSNASEDCHLWGDPNPCKDDNTNVAMGTFAILMALTICVTLFWAYNMYLLKKSGRLNITKIPLLLFQLTSFLTLACKAHSSLSRPHFLLCRLQGEVRNVHIQHTHESSLLHVRLHGLQLHDELVSGRILKVQRERHSKKLV